MESLFIAQILLYFIAALYTLLFRKDHGNTNHLPHVCTITAGVAGVMYSVSVLLTGKNFAFEIPGLPFVGRLYFLVDPLAAFFIFIISFLSVPASIFAITYIREFHERKRTFFLGSIYNLFLATMILVISVQNAFYFLMLWEAMSLTSYFLVVFEHEKLQARRAGIIYLVMTHVGTAFIAASFWLLFVHCGSFVFSDFYAHASTVPPILKNIIFLTALIGFGTKAGIIPLHIWLPEAHPQAPSHVSALMSGVMIKTAIYALIRFLFGFLGDVPLWWGSTILCVAILSTVLGVLYALMEHDLKRLLAFHSIENIGIILLGVGMSLIFISTGKLTYAAFALIAALFHTLNHATFKGLLFLGAGAVFTTAHTRNIEELGGLIKKMPWTAACFLIGSVAISALPPLNGFVSEWMTFIALLAGFTCDSTTIRFFAPIIASMLGFAGALAATCFIKAFGISFLGEARSAHAQRATEVSGSMRFAMGLLAGSCFMFSLSAPQIIVLLEGISRTLIEGDTGTPVFTLKGIFISLPLMSQFSPLMAGGIFLVSVLIMMAVFAIMGNPEIRTGPSWDCGLPGLTPRMQYTATGYSKPLRRIFSFLYQPSRRVELEDEGHAMLRTAQRFEAGIVHIFDEWIYRPLARLMAFASRKAKLIQTGHIQLYLSYIFMTLIVLLIYWSRL